MKSTLLEAGRIVNTHGIRGEVKIQPWADSPDFLTGFDRFFIDGIPVKVLSARVHKSCVIASFDNVSDIDAAIRLKNKVVSISRDDTQLGDGRHFVADLVGLRALDSKTGEDVGVLEDILSLPSNDVYIIRGAREMLVPAVPEFVEEINIDGGYIRLRFIEGM